MKEVEMTMTVVETAILQTFAEYWSFGEEPTLRSSTQAIPRNTMIAIGREIDNQFPEYGIDILASEMAGDKNILDIVLYVKGLMLQGTFRQFTAILVEHDIPEQIISLPVQLTARRGQGGLGIDPTEMAGIVESIEKKFRINIDPEKLVLKKTVQDLVNYILELL